MDITQVVVGLGGALALFLTLKGYKFIGGIIGVITQPLWIFMAIDKKLPGVLFISIIYMIVWFYGLLKVDYKKG